MLKETIKSYKLNELPFFKEMPSDMRDLLLEEMQSIRLTCNEVLFREGDLSDDLYLIASGRIRLLKGNQIIAELNRGEVLGELALLTASPRSATAMAIKDALLLKLSKSSFNRFYDKNSKNFLPLIKSSIVRLLKPKSEKAPAGDFCIFFDSSFEKKEFFIEEFKRELSKYGKVAVIRKADLEGLLEHEHVIDNLLELENPIDHWLTVQEIEHDFVIYMADEALTPWTLKSIRQAERVLILTDSENNSFQNPFTLSFLTECQALNKQIDLILLHRVPEGFAKNTMKWFSVLPKETFIHHLRLDKPQDVARISRLISGHAVTLVLGGGGAPTMVYVGAYKALRELGVPIDAIGASCAGNFIAAFIAMEYSVEEIAEVSRTKAPGSVFQLMDLTIPLLGLIKGGKVERVVRDFYGDLNIEDLWIPFFTVATNISKYKAEVITRGPLWKAVRASVGIPVVMPPVSNVEGDLLIDGAVINNLPVDIMADYIRKSAIIAGRLKKGDIDAVQLPHGKLRFWKLLKKIIKGDFLIRKVNIFEIIDRTSMMASRKHSREMAEKADIVLEFDVQNIAFFQYDTVEELIEIGYQATMKKKEELLKLLQK